MITLEAFLSHCWFLGRRDCVYIYETSIIEELKSREDLCRLEFLESGLVRIWQKEAYEKYILQPKVAEEIRQDKKSKLQDLQEQMLVALDEGNVEKILAIRKQIKELGTL